MNNFDILQIPINSELSVIKSAYRKLCLIHHPDKGGDKNQFIKIQLAYEELLVGKTGVVKKPQSSSPFESNDFWDAFTQQQNVYDTYSRQQQQTQARYDNFKANFKKPIEDGKYTQIKSEILKDGGCKFTFHLLRVKQIELNALGIMWDTSSYDGQQINITVDKDKLKKLDYKLTLKFVGTNGNYAEKSYKITKPLTRWEKIKNWIW